MTNNEIWQSVLAELELIISKANFVTWFKNTGIISFDQGQVLICVPNAFTKAWLEKKYHQQIVKSLERISTKAIKKLEYKIDNIKNFEQVIIMTPAISDSVVTTPIEAGQANSFASAPPANGGFPINPKYTFESFVVGKGSELAYAAAQAVTARPGDAYNPLFIYGGVGLGKTHLIQAVGNALYKKNPNLNVMYVSAEKFSNDFISSIKEGNAKDFQNRYRNLDLFLIDDIQFIAGKDRSQESFFHTFNELHQQNKQVIMTSDRPPKAIPALEDRLKSRFEWGMIADISAPDFETRTAILDKKCQEKKIPLPIKMLEIISANVQSNIRELEGVLNKIIVWHQLKNLVPTDETIKMLIANVNSVSQRRSLTPKQLIDIVCQFYALEREDLVGKNREKKISAPRQVIMYLMREELKMSYPSIGEELGGRDHTTAMHAHGKVRMEIENDLKLRQDIDMLRQRFYVNNI